MLLAKNRKALRNYEIVEKFTAGIVLKGYEVKALRERNVNFEGSYIKLENDTPVVVGLHIGRFSKQSQKMDNLDPKKDRKLLMHTKEILKMQQELNEKGKSAVPLALILNNNLIKLELAIVKGRKKHEKKHLEKERQIKKDLDNFNKEVRNASWN